MDPTDDTPLVEQLRQLSTLLWRQIKPRIGRALESGAASLTRMADSAHGRTPMPNMPPGSWGGDANRQRRHACSKCGAPTPWPGLCPTHHAEAIQEARDLAKSEHKAEPPVVPPAQAPPAPQTDTTRTVGINAGLLNQEGLNDVEPERTPVVADAPKVRRKRRAPKKAGRDEVLKQKTDLSAIDDLRAKVEQGELSPVEIVDLLKRCAELQYAAVDRLLGGQPWIGF